MSCSSRRRSNSLIIQTIVATGVATAVASVFDLPARADSNDQPVAHRYFYFDEARPLDLQPELIAIRPRDLGVTDALLEALDRVRVTSPGAAASIRGWVLATTPADARDAAGYERLVAELADDSAIEFVAPVFRGRCGPLLIGPEILVRFDADVARDRAEAIASLAGRIVEIDVAGISELFRVHHSTANGFTALDAANTLAALPGVRFAEPNVVLTGRVAGGPVIPNDPLFTRLWGLHNSGQVACVSTGIDDVDMDVPEAWAITTGDPSIVTVVIDSGYQLDHPDLNHSGLAMDFTDTGGDGGPTGPQDCHGTTVAGSISAIIDNATDLVGVAPGCRLASARFANFQETGECNASFSSQVDWYADAIMWAQTIGARVTNSSLVLGGGPFATIETAFETTRANGVVHFAATGNDAASAIAYPASSPFVNAVGAIDADGAVAGFSNQGTGIAFVAPGVEVITTDRTGDDGLTARSTVCLNGTSQASPHAAGVAALLLARQPTLTAVEVETIMRSTAVDLGDAGYDTTFGWGLLNARDALLMACGAGADCNANGQLDECELAAGLAPDCNENGVPDECDLPVTSDCCTASTTPGCDDPSCQDAVCAVDAFCCNTAWDAVCVEQASSLCGAICNGSGASEDANGNGVPDECEGSCPPDIDGSGDVDVDDLVAVVLAWGLCEGCPEDVNDDGEVNVDDLVMVILGWGPCEP